MIPRQALLALAVLLATVGDLGWPVWRSEKVGLSLLDVIFLVSCQVCGPTMAVFWGGLTGLLGDVVHMQSPGQGTVLNATIALVWHVGRQSGITSRTFTTCCLSTLTLALFLGVARIAIELLSRTTFTSLELPLTFGQLALVVSGAAIVCLYPFPESRQK